MKNKYNLFGLWPVRAYRKSAKYNYMLDIELEEIIIGLMLGDLYAEKKNSNSNTRLPAFRQKQSVKNKAYIDHLFLAPLCKASACLKIIVLHLQK